MIIAKDKSWLFVSTMKCATNTMYKALPTIGGIRLREEDFHPRPDKREAPLHFTICRNPYDRAVSIWASTAFADKDKYSVRASIIKRGGDPDSFDDFVRFRLLASLDRTEDYLFSSQSKWYAGTIIDKILKIENLDQELKDIGINVKLTVENSRERKPWKEYYTKLDTIVSINKWAEHDFKTLGYENGVRFI